MADNKIIVQLASPERKYVKVYHDFLDNSFLSVEEQMIFIALKSYIDFREDSGEAFPSVDTLCRRAKMSKPRTIKAINNLIKKGIVKKVQRGLTKTNLYTGQHPSVEPTASEPTIGPDRPREPSDVIGEGGPGEVVPQPEIPEGPGFEGPGNGGMIEPFPGA